MGIVSGGRELVADIPEQQGGGFEWMPLVVGRTKGDASLYRHLPVESHIKARVPFSYLSTARA